MSDSCRCFDVRARVVMDEPKLSGKFDFSGEIILCSDGEDYKRGYDEGHAQGLIDGQKVGYENGYNEGQIDGHKSGYEAGKTEGLTEGYDNGYEKGKTDGYKDGYEEGYSKGYEQGLIDGTKEEQEKLILITENCTREILPDDNKVLSKVTVDVNVADSYYDIFWDNFQQNGNRRDYPRAFMGAWWNDENYKPKYPMKPKGSATNMYDNSNISDIGDVDFSECSSFGFQQSGIITLGVIDARIATSIQGLFSVCRKLVSVEKLWCLPKHGFSTTFYDCIALTEIRFEPDTIGKSISFAQSPLLSTDSVESIINGLVDLTGQTPQTVTFHATVKGNLSNDQISDITSQNWTLA